MNRNKYKYLDKIHIQETKKIDNFGYWYDWYGSDYASYKNFMEHDSYLNSKYYDWYCDWLDDPSRLRDIKIEQILSSVDLGNLGERLPKSLFK